VQAYLTYLISGNSLDYIIFLAIFVFASSLFYFSYLFVWPSIEIFRRARAGNGSSAGNAGTGLAATDIGPNDAKLQEAIEAFYESLQNQNMNSISRRLIRAGYFRKSAIYYFYALRIAISATLFFSLIFIIPAVSGLDFALGAYIAGAASLLALIIPNFVLDRLGKRQEERYRRSFPDFMDILIVCADAGLSLEAAVARVAKEIVTTNRKFGIHLNIMMLEVRAGKRLRDALTSFADRLEIDEARSLATVFKQSEELGSSLNQTLRVFSHEMRRARITRAEEKANALPVKMIFPLGLFIFPVMLAVVLFPVMLTLMKMIGQNMPR